MKILAPAHWTAQSDPAWDNGHCVVCGRKTGKRGVRYVRYNAEDQRFIDTAGDMLLPVGSECVKQVPADFIL